jgi:hypothetical protein
MASVFYAPTGKNNGFDRETSDHGSNELLHSIRARRGHRVNRPWRVGKINEKKKLMLPHILAPGVVRNLKATHSPPLDQAPRAVRFLGYLVGTL